MAVGHSVTLVWARLVQLSSQTHLDGKLPADETSALPYLPERVVVWKVGVPTIEMMPLLCQELRCLGTHAPKCLSTQVFRCLDT
ncbi:hypothetical protein NITHO_460004 [Nitrolancea hollandica Lb]|uniref:Uncharacterized protein n=1 Tax=Nitrolancea hollandica Lb TaxID=1129897 RepID=I4EKF6_9BACT|nr:hypothetical protein NITHO_460004 [Nitrolancea hollandica Lb]